MKMLFKTIYGKKMTWVDKMIVTDIKEISNQQYLKYKEAHSTLKEEDED